MEKTSFSGWTEIFPDGCLLMLHPLSSGQSSVPGLGCIWGPFFCPTAVYSNPVGSACCIITGPACGFLIADGGAFFGRCLCPLCLPLWRSRSGSRQSTPNRKRHTRILLVCAYALENISAKRHHFCCACASPVSARWTAGSLQLYCTYMAEGDASTGRSVVLTGSRVS